MYNMEDKNYAFIPNWRMIDNLQIGILSSPIIYIPHYDFLYLKKTLNFMVQNKILGIKKEQICFCNTFAFSENKKNEADEIEYINSLSDESISSRIRFEDGAYDAFKRIMDICYATEDDKSDFDKCLVFVFENITEELNVAKVQYALLKYTQCYEEGKLPQCLTIVIVDNKPASVLPREIEKYIRVVDIPYPDINDRKKIINKWLCNKSRAQDARLHEDIENELSLILGGLTFYEVNSILRTISLAKSNGYLNKSCIKYAQDEKRKIVQKSGVLEVVDTNIALKDVGGLENLRKDINKAKDIYFSDMSLSKGSGLSCPKGILIIGMPGCGKSMIAKAIATEFNVTLLKLDISKLLGKHYGESEQNLQKALQIAEMSSPCVLWIDEVEKAFAGADGKSNSDALMMRVMGQFLTWQQERDTLVYVVATANDTMRSEFMRKGRFDEVYFVDFPNKEEVRAIFLQKLKKYINYSDIYDFSELALDNNMNANSKNEDFIRLIDSMCSDDGQIRFSGAEIECVVKLGIEEFFKIYKKNREDIKISHPECNDFPLVKVTYNVFQDQVDLMKDYVMYKSCNKSKRDILQDGVCNIEHTAIDRIYRLQEQYNLKPASK